MTCPNCGYCEHCGRGGHHHPIYPHPMWIYTTELTETATDIKPTTITFNTTNTETY